MANCKPVLALTSPALASRDDLAARFAGHELQWITVDMTPGAAGAIDLPRPRADDIAFLQYTSGSTSDPKGVVVTHAMLLANMRMAQAYPRHRQAFDLRQLAAALPRHGADPQRGRIDVSRRALRAARAVRLHAAPARLAARDQPLPRRNHRLRPISPTTCASRGCAPIRWRASIFPHGRSSWSAPSRSAPPRSTSSSRRSRRMASPRARSIPASAWPRRRSSSR